MNATQKRIWCDEDEHSLYENFVDFNEWLDGEEAEEIRIELGIVSLTQPSKALFASDREAYDQTFVKFRNERRHDALNEAYFIEQFGNDHWFQRSFDHFLQLIERMAVGEVVPFIGAGISRAGGFPTWESHLQEQGRTANIAADHIQSLLNSGQYETVLDEIESVRGKDFFIQEMRDVFSRTGNIPEVVWRITELFSDTLITTNYDHLVEDAFDTGDSETQVLNGTSALVPDAARTTVIKLHGDIRKPQHCILSKNQYDAAYGDQLDISKPIPKLLSYHYLNSSLLFLGCSLNTDRTLQVFDLVKKEYGEEHEFPQHFSIEVAPENIEELAQRNSDLARLGITPIWFQKDRYEYVENILRLAKSELNYLGVQLKLEQAQPTEVLQLKSVDLDLELDTFLRDFMGIMPLLHWLHKPIPQSATKQYLHVTQRLFVGFSLFSEQLDEDLRNGLDNLLRALCNNPHFDGYTHGKLSIAFKYFQKYLNTHGIRNYVDEPLDCNNHELLSIPISQFDERLAQVDSGADFYAMRMIVILLRHGRNQTSSPKNYCQLPDAISQEVTDYLSCVMRERLGVSIPDRLQDDGSEEIRHLCEMTWANFDKPVKLGLKQSVLLALQSLGMRS
jgi:NAD-dependent SIR2 family protein deacetylase